MRVDGETTTQALMEWYKGYIARYPGLDFDLGKFYFGTSTGTIGAFIAFEKIDTSSSISTLLLTSFLFLSVSLGVSFLLILPAKVNVDENPNIIVIYGKISRRITKIATLWFMTWLVGSFIGLINAV